MKRNSIIKSIVLSAIASTIITGCGSASTTINETIDKVKKDVEQNIEQPTQLSISGKAVDGYLQFSTVCLDLNADGYCQSTEPMTTTLENGSFTLPITPEVQLHEDFAKAMLLVYGGRDMDTGTDFKGKLLAPQEDEIVNISPITTLVAKAVQKELRADVKLTREEVKAKVKDSKEKVAKVFGLTVADLVKDPVAEKENNPKLIQEALKIQKAVEAMNANGTNDELEDIYEQLAESLEKAEDAKGMDSLLDEAFKDHARLADAKIINKNIEISFEKFEDDLDLEKIAFIIKEDLRKIKNEEQLIEINDNNEIFEANHDWDSAFIKSDLMDIGIADPTDDQILKMKESITGNIRPGIILISQQDFKDSQDEILRDIYKEVEKVEAQKNGEAIKIQTPMNFFVPSGRGYEKVTFNANNTISFQEFKINENGEFVEEANNDDHSGFIYKNGQWVAESHGSEKYTLSDSDTTIILPEWKETAQLIKGENISEKERFIPELHTSIAMPTEANMNFIKITKTADTYSLHEPVRNYSAQGDNETFASISDFISDQCGNGWIIGDHVGGVTFAGTKTDDNTYNCNSDATSGELVFINNGNEATTDLTTNIVAGKWETKDLANGIKILVIKPYDLKRFSHDDRVEYSIFALKDGILHRGDFEEKGAIHTFPVYNEAAMDAIKGEVTNNWEEIKDKFEYYRDLGETEDQAN